MGEIARTDGTDTRTDENKCQALTFFQKKFFLAL